MSHPIQRPPGLAGRLAALFIHSKLTPLALLASLALGIFAVAVLPREEEAQIRVPMIDVMLGLPGATPAEVESRLTRPLEQLLWEIPRVEYLYSTSRAGQALIIVRFQVGTELEPALVQLNRRLQAHADQLPPGATPPIVKPRTIDEVPVLALTLHSATQDQVTLRRLAAQVNEAIKPIPDVAETTLIGGLRRTLRIQLDPAAQASYGIPLTAVSGALQQANRRAQPGARAFANEDIVIEAGGQLRTADDVGAVTVGVFQDKPVHVRDLATIQDTGAEPTEYVFHAPGGPAGGGLESGVTLMIAKRPGANAVRVVNRVLAQLDALRGTLLPVTSA